MAIALLPVPFFAAFLLAEIRCVRALDELQQRIQLDALAVAYPCVMAFFLALAQTEVCATIAV